jgi:hypothetical protein
VPLENPSFFASGNIGISTFVSLTPGNSYYVSAATGSTPIIGVAQEGTINAPGTGANVNNYAATQGFQLRVYGPGETALIVLGGTVSAGDYLVATTNSFAITQALTASGPESYIGGQALENGVSGVTIPMRVFPYTAPV